jgi:hypothetical protein
MSFRNFVQCRRNPNQFLRQDFRPLFDAPGYWDRPSAARLIVHAREVSIELRTEQARVRRLRTELRQLCQLIQATLDNDDPNRSP